MIADIQPSFEVALLEHKIDYQIQKMLSGKAIELYNSSGDILEMMKIYMPLVADLNDSVRFPYKEFVLSLPMDDNLNGEKFTALAKDYMEKMGYGECLYTIILNTDTSYKHVHIYTTTVDLNGKWIDNAFDYRISGKVARELEAKNELTPLEQIESKLHRSLNEIQARRFYFDTALNKALKNYETKSELTQMLNASEMYLSINPDKKTHFTNSEWELMLGTSIYNDVLSLLKKKGFLKQLYKDELLSVMDSLIDKVNNAAEFRRELASRGYYMRLVSNGHKSSYYVYGMEDSFYFKDTSLPQRYRFGYIKFDGRVMEADEQKHYLFEQIFAALNASTNYEEFKTHLRNNSISIVEHTNSSGIYGLSYTIDNVECPLLFKSSEISRHFTYKSIEEHFAANLGSGIRTSFDPEESSIEPGITRYGNYYSRSADTIKYMMPAIVNILSLPLLGGDRSEDSDNEDKDSKKRRKKKKNKTRRDNNISM